jgi:hypothetical protein
LRSRVERRMGDEVATMVVKGDRFSFLEKNENRLTLALDRARQRDLNHFSMEFRKRQIFS